VVARLYEEIGRGLNQADMRDRIVATGLEPVAQSPGQFQRLIEAEQKRWAQTIRDARIQTE
jgi:tripartite-type tricarboxylate transporter receptor subunit TctC